MSIDQAEQFKQDLTDKWVTVDRTVPELRRFNGLTGKVKTVNMNCRALVEFDGPADIGWYDIDPGCLTVVDQPLPKKTAAAAPKAEPKAAPSGAKSAGGGSPLDAIRKAGAAGSEQKPDAAGGSPLDAIRKAGAAGSGQKPDAADSGKKAASAGGASPLDMIRKQGAAGQNTEQAQADKAPEAAAAPADEAPPADDTAPDLSGLSIVEQIRRQGAFQE